MSWCDLDLTFHLALVTLTYNILSLLYLSYIFLLESWLLDLLVSFDVD